MACYEIGKQCVNLNIRRLKAILVLGAWRWGMGPGTGGR